MNMVEKLCAQLKAMKTFSIKQVSPWNTRGTHMWKPIAT